METKVQDQFLGLADNIIAYLPSLLAGIVMVLIGWLAGWIIKRILIQISIMLRIDRFLRRSRWEADFSRGDVRYGIYNLIGNIGFTVIFLLFLDNALIAWKLNILADLLSKGILFLPKVIISASIFGLGWLLALWAEKSILKILYREEIPRASLISKFVKIILLLFFSAIALVELDVAHEIVIIGFSTIIITIGAISVVITAVGGRSFIARLGDSFRSKE